MAYTTIDKPDDYFNTVLYTGTGATLSITGVGFQPDLSWLKMRSAVEWNFFVDAVRGVNKAVWSNATNAEYDYSGDPAQILTSFDTDGFSLGTSAAVNGNTQTFASWNWKANGAGVSNTAGSITSTVSANTTSGFSIVSYTGTGSTATIGHGLCTSPSMILIKNRTTAYSWIVYHKSLGATKNLYLDLTNASDTSSIQFNDTEPTSSVFSVGTSLATNKSSDSIIAYCFAEVKGFSKFGSYTGNGNADGTFVYTGFRPAWIMVKASSRSGRWRIWDNKINPFNVADTRLSAESSDAEDTGATNAIDIVSNGFKIRTSEGQFNGSGETNIYMAFAENPFVTSTSIPTTAR
jgi:hypothetical protein